VYVFNIILENIYQLWSYQYLIQSCSLKQWIYTYFITNNLLATLQVKNDNIYKIVCVKKFNVFV